MCVKNIPGEYNLIVNRVIQKLFFVFVYLEKRFDLF